MSLVADSSERVVSRPIVREDHRGGQDELAECSTSVLGGSGRSDDGCSDSPTTLHSTEDHGSLLGCRPALLQPKAAAAVRLACSHPPAEERLVGFYFARQRCVVVVHELVPNLVEHPPCGLVRHPKLTFQVLGGDPASSASDQVHGVEPKLKGRGRTLEDRPLQRVDAEAAGGAEPRWPLLRRVVTLEDPLGVAALAKRMLAIGRVALLPYVAQARLIVGELAHELHQRVFRL